MEQPVPASEISLDIVDKDSSLPSPVAVEETAYRQCTETKESKVVEQKKVEEPRGCVPPPPPPPICQEESSQPEPEPAPPSEPVPESTTPAAAAPVDGCAPCPPCPNGNETPNETGKENPNGNGRESPNGNGKECPNEIGKEIPNEDGKENSNETDQPKEGQTCNYSSVDEETKVVEPAEIDDDSMEPPPLPRAPCPEPLYPICKRIESPCQEIVCPQDDD